LSRSRAAGDRSPTRIGTEALELEDQIGSMSAGKTADLLAVQANAANRYDWRGSPASDKQNAVNQGVDLEISPRCAAAL
jgi:imidazolonepropionase-like amidohydrolase